MSFQQAIDQIFFLGWYANTSRSLVVSPYNISNFLSQKKSGDLRPNGTLMGMGEFSTDASFNTERVVLLFFSNVVCGIALLLYDSPFSQPI